MNRTIFSLWRISPLTTVVALALVWLVSWLGLKLMKYNYPGSLGSAKDVPGWMLDSHFGTFTDADMLALRGGQCSHDPIFVRPKADGTAVLTCGIPAQPGPVRLFVVDALDPNGIYRLHPHPAKTSAKRNFLPIPLSLAFSAFSMSISLAKNFLEDNL